MIVGRAACRRAGRAVRVQCGGSADRRRHAPLQISWEVRNRFRLFREERDFLLHAESRARPQRSRLRAGAGTAERRPRLGAQHGEPALHRSRRPRQRALHPRQRQGKLSDAGRSSGRRSADRPGSGRRHLRLVVRRRRRPASTPPSTAPSRSISGSAMAAPRLPPSMSPADRRRRSASPPRSRCATSSSPASATASPPAKAIRTGRSRLPTKAFASAPISARRPRNITGRAAPAIKADAPAKRRTSLPVWQRQSALWFNSACHRSLYSYQTRTALALAVQYPHIAVTYLPLACTGATIADGLFGSQRARECPPSKSGSCLPGHRQRRNWPNCAKPSPPPSAASPIASSIWCCCRSAPTTSIFPASSPT